METFCYMLLTYANLCGVHLGSAHRRCQGYAVTKTSTLCDEHSQEYTEERYDTMSISSAIFYLYIQPQYYIHIPNYKFNGTSMNTVGQFQREILTF